jgi:hypothetical protein
MNFLFIQPFRCEKSIVTDLTPFVRSKVIVPVACDIETVQTNLPSIAGFDQFPSIAEIRKVLSRALFFNITCCELAVMEKVSGAEVSEYKSILSYVIQVMLLSNTLVCAVAQIEKVSIVSSKI